MMQTTAGEIFEFLKLMAPLELQMDFDNAGFLVGDRGRRVEKALLALDATSEVIDEAIDFGADMIITHHPLIWNAMKSLTTDDIMQRRVMKLVKNNISLVSMHTNLDIADGGVNDAFAAALGLEDPGPLGDPEGLCRVGYLSSPMPLQDFACKVCRDLHANGVRYAGCGKMVHRVAVGGGACADYVHHAITAGCDTFVTADLSYHQFLDAEGMGINLIDAGHFPTEDPVCARLVSYLTDRFPELTVFKSASHREVIQYCVEGE